jgi:peroxiredoxin
MTPSSGLKVGDEAPDFVAPLVHPDGSVEDESLHALLEDGPVLLVFYTNDFTPDCIEEWCEFRDFDWFTASNEVQVVGVSKSRVGTHKRFSNYLDLGFPLYSDRDLAIAEKFAVKYRTLKLLPRARRSCFFVDRDGQIQYTWIAEDRIDPTRDTPDVTEIYEAIRDVLDGSGGSEASSAAFDV